VSPPLRETGELQVREGLLPERQILQPYHACKGLHTGKQVDAMGAGTTCLPKAASEEMPSLQ